MSQCFYRIPDRFMRNILIGGTQFKCQRQKCISGKQCFRFPEFDMTGRFSSTEIVIIHARQVIVN